MPRSRQRFDNPASGIALSEGLSVYHDAAAGEFAAIVQVGGPTRLTVYQFEGSYLSLAFAIPDPERQCFGAGKRLKATLDIASTRPLTVFLRLNCQTDQGTSPLYETIVIDRDPRRALFDLDAFRLPFQSITSAWLDIIFSEPDMCEIIVADVSMEVADRGRE